MQDGAGRRWVLTRGNNGDLGVLCSFLRERSVTCFVGAVKILRSNSILAHLRQEIGSMSRRWIGSCEGILMGIVNQASVNKDPQIVLHDATKRMHEALLNSTTFLGHQELLTMIVPKSSSLRDALTNLRMTPSR